MSIYTQNGNYDVSYDIVVKLGKKRPGFLNEVPLETSKEPKYSIV